MAASQPTSVRADDQLHKDSVAVSRKLHPSIGDICGQRFRRLVVLCVPVTRYCRAPRCLCACDCGGFVLAYIRNLMNGQQSCINCRTRTHSLSKTKTYRTWIRIKSRCLNERERRYSEYGGRGIRVCERWLESFENFLADMGHPPSPSHSIDRIDNDGNYEPSNCRWATMSQQNKNRRCRCEKQSLCEGVTWNKVQRKWIARIYINGKPRHIGRFSLEAEAIAARDAVERSA
jgi:hypothetical protein